MKVLVTGASGFLGRAVVRAVCAQGHDVVALVRPTADVGRLDWPSNVSIVRGDLRQRSAWRDHLEVDAVIHLAAAPSGDLATQFAGTVQASENLLAALPLGKLRRFVHVSSFSVYDFSVRPSGGVLDERSAVEPRPEARDAYTMTKMIQERLILDGCAEAALDCVVIRPGAIYGPAKDWEFGRALKAGSWDIVFAPYGKLRLTHVDNCADAIALALTAPKAAGNTYNIVDDVLPSAMKYHRLCKRAGAPAGRAFPVPWLLVAGLGRIVRLTNRILFRNRAKLPELLEYRRQQARWRPLRYSNARAKADLGWTPRVTLEDGIARMFASKS